MRSNKKEIFLLVSTFIIVVGICGVYGYTRFTAGSETQQTNLATSQPIQTQNSADAVRSQSTPDTLQVQGSSTTSGAKQPLTTEQSLVKPPTVSESPNQPQLPQPSNFSVYEKYKNEQQALYTDIFIGDGAEIKSGDTVSVTYQGWLTDGQLFDVSRSNEVGLIEPFTFKLGTQQVIRGWDEGIVGMKIGGKRRLIIPPAAGYGSTGSGPIPPDSLLVFDVYAAYVHDQ